MGQDWHLDRNSSVCCQPFRLSWIADRRRQENSTGGFNWSFLPNVGLTRTCMRLIELRMCRWVRFMLESFAADEAIQSSIADCKGKVSFGGGTAASSHLLPLWHFCLVHVWKKKLHAIMAYYTLATCVAVSLSSCQIFRSQKDLFPKNWFEEVIPC